MSTEYQSIQVAATSHSSCDIHVVEEQHPLKTHYSVYLRDKDGLCEHVEDFSCDHTLHQQAMARMQAVYLAANLSMQHQVPIEPIE